MAGSTVDPFGVTYTPDPLAQFLSRVVPWSPGGYVNLHAWTPKNAPTDRQQYQRRGGGRAFADIGAEYGDILQFVAQINRDGDEVFVCMSSRDAYEPAQTKGGRPYRKASRATRFNPRQPDKVITKPVALKSLWLDLDVKAKGYPSQEAALAALRAFCADLGLTPGFINSSGGGIHCYIVLDQPITPDRWRPLASSLVNAATAKGLKLDAVSEDDERLMRLPTSFNRKDPTNPLPCMVLETGPDTLLSDLEAALAPYPPTSEVRPTVARPVPMLDPAIFPPRPPITSGPDFARVSAERERNRIATSVDLLRSACPVVADSEARGGDGDIEPLWFELAKLCHYVQDGRDYFHRLSDQDPRYEQAATDQKYDEVSRQGWPQCATIATASTAASAICKTCAYYGKGKSPINYAVSDLRGVISGAMPMQATTPAASAVVPYVNGASAFQQPGMPASTILTPFQQDLQSKGYSQDAAGYILDADNKRIFKTPVSNIDCRWEDTRSGLRVLRFNVMIPDGTPSNADKVVTFLHGEAGTPSGISSIRSQGLTFDPKNHGALVAVMESWVEIVKQKLTMHSDARLGWIMDAGVIKGFAYANYAFDAAGARVISAAAACHQPLMPRGNLNDWRTAANFFVGKGCVEMEVLMATAFAAPLVIFTGAEGVIVFGRADTGYGKSVSLTTSASVWGSRSQLTLSSTMNYIEGDIMLKNNLPVYVDELVTDRRQDTRLAENILRMVGGTGRGRMDRGSINMVVRTACTMIAAASNHSLTEMASSKDTSAQAARVLEIEMSDALIKLGIPQSSVGEIRKMLEANYGQAGLVYAEFLGKHHAAVEQMVTATMKRFETKLGLGPAERFWLAAAAALLVGATISKKLNLMDFDILSMEKFLLEQLRRQRTSVKDMSINPNDPEVQLGRVREFLNSHLQDRIITDILPSHGWNKSHLIAIHNGMEASRARSVVARIAIKDTPPTMLVSDAKLREWCERKEISYPQLYRTLAKAGICTKSKKHRSLGAGTGFHMSAETVLIFDLTFPANVAFLTDGV